MSRYRDPQVQVTKKYLNFLDLSRKVINPYSAGIDYRRQNLTSIVDPRTVRVKIFYMYSNNSEKAN